MPKTLPKAGSASAYKNGFLLYKLKHYLHSTVAPGMCGRGKVPQKNTGSCTRHRNAYGIVLHCNGNPAEHFYLLYRKGKFRPAALPKNTFERKGIGSHCHELSAETFFPPFRSKSRITHNANNSEATEQVRNLLGFTGFLVVQTFNSQDLLKSLIIATPFWKFIIIL